MDGGGKPQIENRIISRLLLSKVADITKFNFLNGLADLKLKIYFRESKPARPTNVTLRTSKKYLAKI
jgi:hypothetical protein